MKKINFIFLRSSVGLDERFKDLEKSKFLDKLNEENDFIFDEPGEDIFFIETGGTEEIFKRIFSSYKEPYILLATDANNSLPASLEIATFLRNNNKKFRLIHGSASEVKEALKKEENSKIYEKSHSFSHFEGLNNMRLGVVGKPSNWLIASDVDYKEVKAKFGVTLVDISSDELLVKIKEAKPKLDPIVFEPYLNKKVNQKTLDGALQIYSALRDLIIKYNLNGLTVRCFDLLDSVKNTSCLALAMLNKDGYIATCEGDIPAMLTMAIIRKAFHQSSFQVNPSYLNLNEGYGYFAHCTLPLDMCLSYEFDTHFESGIGIGIKGRLNLGKVTIFKLNGNLTDYEVFEGSIVENLHKNNLCRTQVKIKFNEPIDEMFSKPNGNHLIIFLGAHKDELVDILSN